MAYTDYPYDPYATSPTNLISNETVNVDITIDRSVFPLEQPFYGDLNGFVVEGSTGGAFRTLVPEVDFQYSPMWLEASAKTGKSVFSYIILLVDVSQVRLNYRAVGKYNDRALMAQIAATTFNRANIHEWSRIWGDDEAYNPRVRDPDLHDKSHQEVLHIGIEKILNALAFPLSGSAFTLADATKLQLDNGGAATVEQLNNFYQTPEKDPEPITNGVPKEILTIPDSFSSATFIVVFISDSGESHTMQVMLAKKGLVIDQTIIGEVSSNDTPLIIDVDVSGGEIHAMITPSESGTVTTKLLFAI